MGLDVKSARLIREIIQELREQNVTVFLTTHNIEEANARATSVLSWTRFTN